MSGTDTTVLDGLKDRLQIKLKENPDALDTIDRKVKDGMCAAIEWLRGDKTKKAAFADIGFKKGDVEAEVKALRTIYKYLESVELTWTLETIIQETNIARSGNADVPSLIDLLKPPGEKPPQEAEASEAEESELAGEEEEYAVEEEED
jgi:hypothetical protein